MRLQRGLQYLEKLEFNKVKEKCHKNSVCRKMNTTPKIISFHCGQLDKKTNDLGSRAI